MESYSFATRLRAQAAARPHAPAVTTGGRTRTYADLDALADRAAADLRGHGVRRGDRVAYLGPNGIAFAAVMYGASRLRAASLALNWRLPAAGLAAILADAEPSVLVAAPEQAEAAEAAARAAGFRGPVLPADGWPPPGPADPPPDDVPEPDDLAMLCYTSGTTGTPKGVMATNLTVLNHLARPGVYPYAGPDAVLLNCAPVFHAAGAGWLWVPAYQGAHLVLLAQADPPAVLDALRRHRVTAALLVPAVLRMLLDDPSLTDLPDLRTIVYGASPIAEPVLRRAMAAFPGAGFVQVYGMTETTGPVTRLDEAGHRDGTRLRTAGRPFDGIEVRVVEPGGDRDRAPGETGEVWVRGDQTTPGYWRAPEATAGLYAPGGWLRTGDAGFLDADGFLHLTDRIKDMIVSGGENVYAAEVENALASCPGVADVCVIGVPHPKWGETVKAVVVGTATAGEVIAHARARLAHYQCPTSVDFVAELPRNPAGKVLRRLVREPYWDDEPRYVT
ncbi:class I adenylate-forming enzyme family protein [Actinomadura montaniterrae]|uniref:Long-chain fatty acid--CoA ligase n=1 Tax=Actinomadura montaniterrae TaxID=1803903 RepID=A0A6L3VNQ3_9ACTN|nr:AMP-binding protein [Actinomadura montaniterrae]KAB2372631.1 long-chain fatty acid--CoA ligase [Actinomadura montaniterrae]